MRYSFSGHESFHCKPLWLKKGFDHLNEGHTFLDENAVAEFGVGKNMVASIRFWMKAFALTDSDELTMLSHLIFSNNGFDPFCEDIGTLWLLHYQLVTTHVASIYDLTFTEFQRERREFDKEQLLSFIHRKCNVPEQKNVYNENTVKKDISVMLQTYVPPTDLKQLEHFGAMFIGLSLIIPIDDGRYRFAETDLTSLPNEIMLFAIIDIKGNDKTVSFDKIQYLSLLFCMPVGIVLEKLIAIAAMYPDYIDYNDNSGIRNLLFKHELDKYEVLNQYYSRL